MAEFSDSDRKFLAAMREAVIERGYDYTYDPNETGPLGEAFSCTYLNYETATFPEVDMDDVAVPNNVENLPPSCIIGCAAVNSGLVDKFSLFHAEGSAANMVLSATDLSIAVIGVSYEIQISQDDAEPWGMAYDTGLTTLSEKGYDVKEFRI